MNRKNTYQRFLKNEPIFHVFFWAIVLFYPYLKYIDYEGGYKMPFLHELNSLIFKMAISYFLYYWYSPKKNKRKYLWVVIVFLISNALLYEFVDGYFHTHTGHFWKHFMTNILTFIGFGIVFYTLYSIKKMYLYQIQLNTLLEEKKQAEMNVLKAQINPHFLFNTLNTIYANALKKDDKTPELILKLSDGFRYLFDQGQKEYVSLKQELKHLKDYVALQQERLSDKVTVEFSEDIENSEQLIAPLLLIPFIENAFKYTSLLKGENHLVSISITLIENQLSFHCTNPFDKEAEYNADKSWVKSGVGQENIKKRLKLLYPERHSLQIEDISNLYKINLSIKL